MQDDATLENCHADKTIISLLALTRLRTLVVDVKVLDDGMGRSGAEQFC
jgi:hypothetical protein